MNWSEATFHQKPLGGLAVKPTTVGGSLDLTPSDHATKKIAHGQIKGSWELARWPPGMMTMIAHALMEQVMKSPAKIRVLSWAEHIAFGHTPARRDCKVCQENQQSSPHKKVKRPLAGVLSLDTAGPLIPAYNQGGHMACYFLVGALTWAVPKGRTEEGGQEESSEEDEEALVRIEPGEDADEDPGEDHGAEDEPRK